MKSSSSSVEFTTLGVKHHSMFGMLFPMSSFLLILQELEKIESLVDYKNTSKHLSQRISFSISSKINSKQKIEQIIDIINQLGFGTFEIKIISRNKIVISHKKYISTIFQTVYSIKPSYICEKIMFHFIMNCLEEVLEMKILNFEILCTNSHLNLVCSDFSKKSTNTFSSHSHCYGDVQMLEYSNLSNPIIVKIKQERQLVIKNGVLSLWKTSGIFIPFEILNNLFKLIDSQNSRALEIIAQLQLYSAVQLQKNVFGIKDNEQIFSVLLLQTILIGIGEAQVISKTNSKIKIRLNSQLFEDSKNTNTICLELEKFCIFILKGIIEFGLDVQTTFIKSESQSNIYYTFKIEHFGRELQEEEIELSKKLSANIQINKFV